MLEADFEDGEKYVSLRQMQKVFLHMMLSSNLNFYGALQNADNYKSKENRVFSERILSNSYL